MRYLSPSSLFGESLQPPLDVKAIQLARKKLFAELELQAKDHIEFHGQPFTKNDIIVYFEDLLKENALEYHNAIEEDRVLLGFLEDSRMGVKDRFKDNTLYAEPGFVRWISPYFCTSFTAYVDACFREMNDDGLGAILNNKLLLTDRDQEESWRSTIKTLTSNVSFLEYYSDQLKRRVGVKAPLAQVSGIMGFRYIRMIQLLPKSRFGELRNRYAFSMMQACIYIFNRNPDDRFLAKTCLENAGLLAVSEGLKSDIADKLEEMNGIDARMEKKKAPSPWRLVLIAIVIIGKVATCSSFQSHQARNYDFGNTPIYFKPSKDTVLRFHSAQYDSPVKALQKTK